MSINYIEIISKNYPTIGCHVVGDVSIYENIVWDQGDPVSKEVLDGLYLNTIRADVWETIKLYRDSRKFKGIYVSGYWFHNDPDSRTQWLGLKDKARDVLANGGNTSSILTINHPVYGQMPIQWSTMNNSLVPVSVQLAFDIVEKTGDLDGVLYGIALYHKQQLYSSQDPANYNYKSLWPPIFGE